MSTPPHTAELRTAHLVRCLEEADARSLLFSRETKETVRLRSQQESTTPGYTQRAEQLLLAVPKETRTAIHAALQDRETKLPPWLAWWRPVLCVAAFLIGWFSHQFGPDRLIDILAFPLIGLIIWNLGVFMLAIWQQFRPCKAAPLHEALANAPEAARGTLVVAWHQFSRREANWRGGAETAQKALWFHVAALLLALGVVGGMYGRGLAKEFHAGWESTFLQAPQVHQFLTIVLKPAQLLTGLPIPTISELTEMRLPLASPVPSPCRTYAAPLIHLWAITAGITIGLSRFLLIGIQLRQLKNLRSLPAKRLAYLRSQLEAETTPVSRGASSGTALVIPVYYGPGDASMEALRACLATQWGTQPHLQVLPPVEIGEEDAYLAAHPLAGNQVVVLFSLAATPEMDVHGAFLTEIATRHPSKLLVGLDAFSFDARHHTLGEFQTRRQQRLQSWQRLLGTATPWVLLDEAAKFG